MERDFNHSLRVLIAEVERQGENHLMSVAGFALTDESREIALLIYRLVMQTSYFKPDAKNYLISRKGSYRRFQKDDKCAVNRNTSISRIRYDIKKLEKLLGIDNLNRLFDGTITDLEEYKQKLRKKIREYERKSLFNNYWVKIDINIEDVQTVEILSEEERKAFETLQKYGTWEGKKLLEGLMNKRIAGHIKYLKDLE